MFEQDEELKQYKNNVHFSLVENYGKSLSGDLQKLSEEVAKFPEHHTFVDEFIIKLNKVDDVKVEEMMSKGCLPKKKTPYGGTLSQPYITPSPPSKLGKKIEGTFFGF